MTYKNTECLNDCSIKIIAKMVKKKVVNMEKKNNNPLMM